MAFHVLTADGEDEKRWQKLIAALPCDQRDLHFLPEYGKIYEKTYGQQPFLALYEDGEKFLLQPYVKRQLNNLAFLKEQGITDPYFDISNPYGYGGPISNCPETNLYQEFDRKFRAYCEDEHIASEFTSLHPLLGNHKLFMGSGKPTPVMQKEVVYVDLSTTEDDIWRGINRGHRSSINKARREGVKIQKVTPDAANLAIFNDLYYHTMRRNEAAQRWFFPENYFRNCLDLLGEERVSLFIAFVKEEPASAYFLIHDFEIVYYHFGGSYEHFFGQRPNNLLMYEVALWAKRNGFLYYYLGGGVSSSPNDPLFMFKSGFSDCRSNLYTYARVHHQRTYDELCTLKNKYERSIKQDVTNTDYFPIYRR